MKPFTLVLGLLLAAPLPVWACATLYRQGYAVPVQEEALIVWDAATQTEHFIRQSRFETDQPEMGFWVPTPTRPTLATADAELFARLTQAILPRKKSHYVFHPSLLTLILAPQFVGSADRAGLSLAKSVQVLEQQQVGPYQATILQANDSQALTTWLKDHGMKVRPALAAWLKPYLAQGWYFTAFQLAKGVDATDLPAVRLSFKTPAPLYPYTEPDEGAQPGRSLRLFLVSTQPMQGIYDVVSPGFQSHEPVHRMQPLESVKGASMRLFTAPWPEASHILGSLAPASQQWWLNAWIDRSAERPAVPVGAKAVSELYFYPTPESTYIPEQTETVHLYIPFDILGLGLYIRWRWRALRRKRSPQT